MKDLEIMDRMEKVNKQLKQLNEIEKEREQLKNDCKHNIIVVTDEHNSCSINARCLFCERKFESNRELYGYEGVVNISEYNIIFSTTDRMISEVKRIYKDIVSQNVNLQPREISKMIKEKFEDKYRQTKETLDNIAKKIREKM